jgi:ubiquinone biosynthesis monooxygenase Coq7
MAELDEALTIQRILKVNHAGEHGAIRIYGAQISVSKILWPSVASVLDELRQHEVEHCRLFRQAMPEHGARPCRAMFLWGAGGYLLGLTTALCSPRLIWVCTEAVESAVHRHLDDQLSFLERRSAALHALIASIQKEELSHLHAAQLRRGSPGAFHRISIGVIGAITDGLIWLSTQGDSARMAAALRANRQSAR